MFKAADAAAGTHIVQVRASTRRRQMLVIVPLALFFGSAAAVPPSISGTPPSQATVGEDYRFTVSATDADGDGLRFFISNLPSWAWFNDRTGLLAGKPSRKDIGQYQDIRIGVTDSRRGRRGIVYLPEFDIAVTNAGTPTSPSNPPPPPSQTPPASQIDPAPPSSQAAGAPTISGNPAGQALVGEQYRFTPVATDPDGDDLRFFIFNLPSWAWFNDRTGLLAGKPSDRHIGRYDHIRIGVTDSRKGRQGIVYMTDFSIVVTNTATQTLPTDPTPPPDQTPPPSPTPAAGQNRAPTISGVPFSHAAVGQFYSFTPSAADADADNLRFFIWNLPSWAWFNDRTGRLAGKPSRRDIGQYEDIRIAVTDSGRGRRGAVFLPTFRITVANAGSPVSSQTSRAGRNGAPTISGNPSREIARGHRYSFLPSALDPDGDGLSFSVSNLPSWLSFDASTGRLSGIPGAAHVGSNDNIIISVTDGAASSSLSPFAINVVDTAAGAASLSWQAPTTRIDGSVLDNLAGFRLLWGTSPGKYTHSVNIATPGISSYVIEELAPATYYFVVTARDRIGLESDYSNVVQMTIRR